MIVPKRMADMVATRMPARKTVYKPNLRKIIDKKSSPVHQDWNKKGGEEEAGIHGPQHCEPNCFFLKGFTWTDLGACCALR